MNNVSYIEGLQHHLSVKNFAMSLKRYAMWLCKLDGIYYAFFPSYEFYLSFYETLHAKNVIRTEAAT